MEITIPKMINVEISIAPILPSHNILLFDSNLNGGIISNIYYSPILTSLNKYGDLRVVVAKFAGGVWPNAAITPVLRAGVKRGWRDWKKWRMWRIRAFWRGPIWKVWRFWSFRDDLKELKELFGKKSGSLPPPKKFGFKDGGKIVNLPP